MKSLKFIIKENSIGWLEWDKPNSSTNLLSLFFMEELNSIIKVIELAKLKALVLISKKSNSFCAGADIKGIRDIQTKKEVQSILDRVHDIFCRFEQLKLSKIAAIHGPCLGGGLEWALCFDYRLISNSPYTRLSLPEVQLGLIPGFGGCLRLPRLIGLKKSLSMVLMGKSLNSKQAHQIALADERIPSLILEKRSLEFAREIVKGKKPAHPKTSYKIQKPYSFIQEKTLKPVLVFMAKKQILKKTKGFYPAPLKALEVIQKTYGHSISKKTLEAEKEAFCEMFQTPESKNLIRLWTLIDKAKKTKIDKIKKTKINKTLQKPIEKIGILGAGVMGRAIAHLFADKGFKVRLVDNNTESLCQALHWSEKLWERQKQKQNLNSYEFKQKINNLSVSTNLWGLSTLDLVIETLPENKKIKQEVIQEVSEKLNPQCLFASNTSSLCLSELAQSSLYPKKFFGLHFFNPVYKIPLVEIGLTDGQQELSLYSVGSVLKKLGKTPLFVKDSPGFVVNRLLVTYLTESLLLFEEGCEIETIDHCYKAQFGLPLGPFELMDQIGLDICVQSISYLKEVGLNLKTPQWTPQLTEVLGKGAKSGSGFYIYNNRKASLNEKTRELKQSDQKAVLSDEKIIQRGVFRMINEGKRLLKDQVAQSEEDIDMALILGMGFPPFLGGPMKYAKSLNLSQVKKQMEEFSSQYGQRFKPHF